MQDKINLHNEHIHTYIHTHIMYVLIRCVQDKINLHNEHVSVKIKQIKHEIALSEAEAASLNATLQALDGKQLEADEAIQELEDKRLGEQVFVCVCMYIASS